MNYFNNINLNQNELQKAVMHPLEQPPATAKQGQMYFNTVDKKLYYYNDTKWVAVNDIDLSNYATIAQLNNKLDKQTTTDSNTQVYAVTGNEQKMIDATSAPTGNTVVLRDASGRFQAVAGNAANDVVNKGQMDTAIAAAVGAGVSGSKHTNNKVGTITDPGDDTQYPNTKAVVNYVKSQVSKVKDVTLDGTSIVNTETGVVALESTYSITLTGISGTLTQEQYDNLNGDNASYIWYKTEEIAAPVRLIKQQKANNDLSYQTISGITLINVTIKKDSKAWTWKAVTRTVQLTEYKVTDISNSSTDTQYPSAKAVYRYVTAELGKIDQFKYTVSTNAASTPEGIVWYSGATESTKITGTLKASATTEYTIYLVPCKHTASETQKGYDEYLTIKNSADQYVWEVLGNTRDLDLSDYVSKTATGTQIIASDLRIKAGNKFTTYGNGTIGYTTDNGVTEYVLNLPQKGGIIAVTDDIPTNYVTTDTVQTILAPKIFSKEVAFDDLIRVNGSVGTAGQVLTSQGAGKVPEWTTLTIPQGTVKKFVRDFTGNNTNLEFSYEHKLGTNQCTVSLYKLNDSNNYEMVMADIILTTTNVIIKFAQAPTTTDSFRVVVTG